MKAYRVLFFYIMFAAIGTFLAVSLLSCTSENDTGAEKKGGVEFFYIDKPGPWVDQALDHDPEITITRVDDRKILNVHIPFARQTNRKHYVEAILVLDMKRNELKKKSMEAGRGLVGAQFDFPDNYQTPVYVVMKCNLHDMWEKLVDWSE